MHRVDVPSATPDNLFTEGSPSGGVPATILPAAWLNDVQENVCKAIELSGITLVKGNAEQLYDAIVAANAASFLSQLGVGGRNASDYLIIPFRDRTTGVRRELIVQWGSVAAANTGSVTFPIEFPNAARYIGVQLNATTGNGATSVSSAITTSTAGFTFNTGSVTSQNHLWLAVGN